MSVPKRSILLTGALALVVAVAGVLVYVGVGRSSTDPSRRPDAAAARCARGYEPVVDALAGWIEETAVIETPMLPIAVETPASR